MKTIISCNNTKFMTLKHEPEAKQRFMWFSKRVEKEYKEVSLTNNDEYIVYADVTSKVGFNKKLYLKPCRQKGFSFNKQTKELKLWFGTNLTALDKLKQVLNMLKLEWVTESNLTGYLTKGLLQKILVGKITNPLDACKYIITYNRFQKTTSPKFLMKWIISNRNDKRVLMSAKYVAKDVNHFLNPAETSIGRLMYAQENLLFDCFRQASILEEKIDFKWSLSRLKQEHTDWTARIMEMEVGMFEDIQLPIDKLPKLPPEFEIITSRKRLLNEGTVMKHCIYTNYAEEWEAGEYLVLHCIYNGEEVTIGMVKRGDAKKAKQLTVIDQCYLRENNDPSPSTLGFIEKELKRYQYKLANYMRAVQRYSSIEKSKDNIHYDVCA